MNPLTESFGAYFAAVRATQSARQEYAKLQDNFADVLRKGGSYSSALLESGSVALDKAIDAEGDALRDLNDTIRRYPAA